MKYFTFRRESNDFTDILKDINLKKLIDMRITWYQFLMIGMEVDEKISSYITLKYGDEMVRETCPDRSPKPGVDYLPRKR